MATKLFTKQLALLTLTATEELTSGHLLVESPALISVAGMKFIEGRHAKISAVSVRGKRVLVPLNSVTSITEFESVDEVNWEQLVGRTRTRQQTT